MYYVYRLADGLFLRGETIKPDHDPTTEGVDWFPEHLRPDARLERYDSKSPTKKRPATEQEIEEYDGVKKDQRVVSWWESETSREWRALVEWVSGRLGIAPETARDELTVILKRLNGR